MNNLLGGNILFLYNIRIEANIALIIRSAEIFGIKEIFLFGKKPLGIFKRPRLTSGAINFINFQVLPKEFINNKILEYKNKGYKIIGLEIDEKAKPLYKTQFKDKNVFIIGSESIGIPTEIIKQIDELVFIPQIGKTPSLNVGVATSILLYKLLEQKITQNDLTENLFKEKIKNNKFKN